MHPVRIGRGVGEDIGPVGGAHLLTDAAGRPAVGGLAAGRQQQHLVAVAQVGQRVRDHHDHTARVGELAHQAHHLTVQRRIQPGCGFVEDQQRRAGQQLHGHRGALALSTRQLVDACLGVLGHLEFLENPGHDLLAILLGGIRRQP
ncbi:Uncharacterised protein [Mycobacteroides abscessus subsp. abscessus]|nr:Uncharacterised protein [Mycobacteroides abscessus subsp. abscessus]